MVRRWSTANLSWRENIEERGFLLSKILVHVHVFYPEIWPELEACIENYRRVCGNENVDVVVTYPESRPEMPKLCELRNVKHVTVANRGYDIGPFIHVLHNSDLDRYDYIVKLHTKRDVKEGWVNFRRYSGNTWRKALLSFCASEKSVRNSMCAFARQRTLGMIADKRMIDPSGIGSCHHSLFSDKGVRELGLIPKGRTIVWGTMFIARARLLKPFLKWRLEDFPPPSSLDPHRIEGLASRAEGAFGMVINAQGYRVSDGRAPAWMSVIWADWMKCVYTIMRYTSDLLRGNKN